VRYNSLLLFTIINSVLIDRAGQNPGFLTTFCQKLVSHATDPKDIGGFAKKIIQEYIKRGV
jgi:hypothetical protein